MNAQTLVLTDNAANKVRQLRDSEGNQELMLRVYVTGGGCSGFSYGFNFAESMNEDDAEFINGDVKMLVDSLSYQYLVGSEVDYIEGLEGSRFVVQNPNATTTCGCGSSFSIYEKRLKKSPPFLEGFLLSIQFMMVLKNALLCF